jgi:G:T-mismatch repair DNA endonuclease (very short patch repair protein)
MITCTICNTQLKDRRMFGIHLATIEKNKFSSKVERERFLVDTLFGKQIVDDTIDRYKREIICINDMLSKNECDIIKLITLMGIKRSSSEERKTERYKQKYLNGIRKIYGDDITNISQSKIIQKKKEETYTNHYGSYEEYLKIQREYMKAGQLSYIKTDKFKIAQQKLENICLAKYGHKNFGSGEKAKQKSLLTRKETIAKWDAEERAARTYAARCALRNVMCGEAAVASKPEKRIRHCLTELDIEFKTNIFIDNFNYDIVFEKYVIEVQGIFWHADPKKYKADDIIMDTLVQDIWSRDKLKKEIVEKKGYKLIAIWEDQITPKGDEELVEFVKQIILEAGYVFN